MRSTVPFFIMGRVTYIHHYVRAPPLSSVYVPR